MVKKNSSAPQQLKRTSRTTEPVCPEPADWPVLAPVELALGGLTATVRMHMHAASRVSESPVSSHRHAHEGGRAQATGHQGASLRILYGMPETVRLAEAG